MKSNLAQRYRAEKRFRYYGVLAIIISLAFLFALLFSVVSKGYSAFEQTMVKIPIYLDAKIINPDHKILSRDLLVGANYNKIIYSALAKILNVDISDLSIKKDLKKIYSDSSPFVVEKTLVGNPNLLGKTIPIEFFASADIDMLNKGKINLALPQTERKISDRVVNWVKILKKDNFLYSSFNKGLFINSDSSNPEKAGLATAFIGSLYLILIVLIVALPVGVAASLYLEEYAPKNKLTDLIEININNLAAVPSIVFGLLGLAIFINFLSLPRSSSLVGGLVLGLASLPTIIITTRSALRAVPSSIKAGAMALGASKPQAIFHHVLPLATPGILTGTIIAVAQAMGQTAPLLLIGMVAFVANYPLSPFDPTTVLPVQIYIWSGEMHRAYVERTSAAIIILLLFIMCMNILAIILRSKFEKRGKY